MSVPRKIGSSRRTDGAGAKGKSHASRKNRARWASGRAFRPCYDPVPAQHVIDLAIS